MAPVAVDAGTTIPGIDWMILACGLHSAAFALFHLDFWRRFGWPRTLQSTTVPNRAIVQIANLQLVWVFTGVGLLCLLYPEPLVGSPLGRALLAGMAIFWAIRVVAQVVWLRVNHRAVHALTATFVLGAVLFALPLLG